MSVAAAPCDPPRGWPGAGPGRHRSQASESPGHTGGRLAAASPLPRRRQSGCSAFQPAQGRMAVGHVQRLVASSHAQTRLACGAPASGGLRVHTQGAALCRAATGRRSLGSCPSVTQRSAPRCPSAVSQGLSGRADEAIAASWVGWPSLPAVAFLSVLSPQRPWSGFSPLLAQGSCWWHSSLT